eukprot:TRINITY_DN29114_c0_g1_i1.p2 TRINITY_DN29114_c0_g1~~TRINITY_DN29114_c0_g1_i1.p2  ORF type:complete len:109 (-),score=11.50 TRINITY_DN29114_c0_g1_i1:120-413(-)
MPAILRGIISEVGETTMPVHRIVLGKGELLRQSDLCPDQQRMLEKEGIKLEQVSRGKTSCWRVVPEEDLKGKPKASQIEREVWWRPRTDLFLEEVER